MNHIQLFIVTCKSLHRFIHKNLDIFNRNLWPRKKNVNSF